MLIYLDGTEVRVGDRVVHGTAAAVVEGDDLERWELEEPGFLVVCEQCGRVYVEVGSL
jgi:hypothetical protein